MRLGVIGAIALLAGAVACTSSAPQTPAPATTPPPDVALASPPTVDVTFLANEGVLLSAGETRVVIDGLFQPYKTYAVMPAADRERIEASQPPFDGIDLVLVSHMHGDHFHAESVARHLRHNPQATLVTSGQVVAEVAARLGADDAVRTRLRDATPARANAPHSTSPAATSRCWACRMAPGATPPSRTSGTSSPWAAERFCTLATRR
jgi:glyoxylase-like metal-dependent hydrolase (beta-lactamase superfamily II)